MRSGFSIYFCLKLIELILIMTLSVQLYDLNFESALT